MKNCIKIYHLIKPEKKKLNILTLSNMEQKLLAVHSLSNIEKNIEIVDSRDVIKPETPRSIGYFIAVCKQEHYMQNALILMENVNEKLQDKIAVKLLYIVREVGLIYYFRLHKDEQTNKIKKIFDNYVTLSVMGVSRYPIRVYRRDHFKKYY